MGGIRLDVCSECGRHAVLRGCDGRKISAYFFSRNAGLEMIKDLRKDDKITLETYWKLHDALRDSILPTETPEWMGELLNTDMEADERLGVEYDSEQEVFDDIHDFLKELFPIAVLQ